MEGPVLPVGGSEAPGSKADKSNVQRPVSAISTNSSNLQVKPNPRRMCSGISVSAALNRED